MRVWVLDEDEVTALIEGVKLVRRLRAERAPTPSGNFGEGQTYDLSVGQIDDFLGRLEAAHDIVLQDYEEDGEDE